MIYEARERERRTNERVETREALSDARTYDARTRGTGTARATVNLATIDTCEMRRSATRGPDALTSTPCTYAQRSRGISAVSWLVWRTLKRTAIRSVQPANAPRHRRINFSPILTEIDLTPDEPGEDGKKKDRRSETSYRFADGLCRKCRRLAERTSASMERVTSPVQDRTYWMVRGRARFCRNSSFEIV